MKYSSIYLLISGSFRIGEPLALFRSVSEHPLQSLNVHQQHHPHANMSKLFFKRYTRLKLET